MPPYRKVTAAETTAAFAQSTHAQAAIVTLLQKKLAVTEAP